MLRLPKKVVMLAGLLAAVPSVTLAGPFDFLKPKSNTVVAAQSERTNQQVANEIAGALKQANLKGFDINIEYSDGVATLHGKISDASQKAAATKAANSIDGVVTVNNQLELVAAPAKTPSGRPAPQRKARPQGNVQQVAHQRASRNNQQVAQQIADSLVAAGLGDSGIEVRYKDGGCSLSGDLSNPQHAMTAYQLASRVPEVQQVLTDHLTVSGQPFRAPAIQPAGYNQQAMLQQMQGPGFPQPVQPAAGQYAPQQGVTPAGFGPEHSYHSPFGGALNPHEVYNSPNLPAHAWPAQAAYDNYAAVSYPSQYDASAWPYIGPFYPYPQVPLGWRDAQLSWDDGYWNLKFNSRTDRWWWFLNPENWH
ncbi:MAG: BON domain-containing protein [Planctomycetaceae bacterium]|nr:BON domain-containing protein [Planctomycetaceae bacterium]